MQLTAHGEQSALRFASHAQRCRVHRIPPRVRDDRDTPLLWGGMRKIVEMIWGWWKQEYFCKGGWTENSLTGKSSISRPGFRVMCRGSYATALSLMAWIVPQNTDD